MKLGLGRAARLKGLIKSWGCDLVGFGDVREGLSTELIHHPVAISLAIENNVEDYPTQSESDLYIHINPDAESKMAAIQKNIVLYLRNLGYLAFPIPPNTVKNPQKFHSILFDFFPHRMGATCAGLGWIGKNGMLINSKLGLRLIWATVLTNAPLTTASPVMETECKECNLCVDACPSDAIHGVKWNRAENPLAEMVDIDACMGQLKSNEKEFGSAVCGICTTICPLNFANHYRTQEKPVNGNGNGLGRGSGWASSIHLNGFRSKTNFNV